MSLLDDASLVVVPSGYKAGTVYSVKPTNGDGDLSFTRSNDTATRVNSAGLIEKVRTNLSLNSQTGASWAASGSTVDSTTTADPLGGTAAVQFTALGGVSSNVYADNTISITSGTPYAGSVYVKNVDANYVQLTFSTATFGSGQYRNFNLTNGTLAGGIGLLGSTIEDVGGGWYRISIAATATASAATGALVVIITPSASASRLQAATAGQTLIAFGIQLESGDIATDYIPTTTTAVSVGMLANVPRLDYSGGGCPKLLLEPQRTNLVLYSEQFDNAAWTKGDFGTGAGAPTITPNAAISPSGYQDADRIDIPETTGSEQSVVYQFYTGSAGISYNHSIYLKGEVNTTIIFRNVDGLDTPINVTTEWQRFDLTGTSATTSLQVKFGLRPSFGTGTVACTIYAWGAQVEAGSYATSYINTLSAAVTRGADACSKTGISSLIGQTEGTIYVDFDYNQPTFDLNGRLLQVYETNDTTNSILPLIFGDGANVNQFQLAIFSATSGNIVIAASAATVVPFGRQKFAIAYNAGVYTVYRNGSLFASGSGAAPVSLTAMDLGGSSFSTRNLFNPINQALLFPTRLTNTQLAELTTL